MYGRRRRPLLGAAVVLGASNMAANRAVEKNNQKQFTAQQTEDLKQSEAERAAAEAKYNADRATWEKERQEGGRQGNASGGMPESKGGNTRYCGGCGNPYVVGANFCVGCGTKLT
jgi:hypothetical protein